MAQRGGRGGGPPKAKVAKVMTQPIVCFRCASRDNRFAVFRVFF